MQQYKKDFITFMIENEALKFGDFTLKSGRRSPFFMNAGSYVTGKALKHLGLFYAQAIHDNFGTEFDILFGPAYKGIPLSVVTSIAFFELYGKEIRYCSNRKEIKDHGADSGILLGSNIQAGDRVIMIEDVTTSGKSIKETLPILQSFSAKIQGLIVSLDREEKGNRDITALTQIEQDFGFPTHSIVSMSEVVKALYNVPVCGKIIIDDKLKTCIDAYYAQYGVK